MQAVSVQKTYLSGFKFKGSKLVLGEHKEEPTGFVILSFYPALRLGLLSRQILMEKLKCRRFGWHFL